MRGEASTCYGLLCVCLLCFNVILHCFALRCFLRIFHFKMHTVTPTNGFKTRAHRHANGRLCSTSKRTLYNTQLMALVHICARGTSTVNYRHRFLNTVETLNLANRPPPGAASKREPTVTPMEGLAVLLQALTLQHSAHRHPRSHGVL